MIQQVLLWIAGAVLTILLAVVGAQQAQLNTLDGRLFAMQKESVSESKLKDMEDRMNANWNNRIEGVRLEIALTNKYLERILEDSRNKR